MFKPYKHISIMNELAQIFSSKVRSEIFKQLFGIDTPELHMRDIERKTGFAIATVRQEMTKLVKLGVVLKRIDGNRTYFRANNDHPIYQDLHQLVLKTVGLVDYLRKPLDHPKIHFAFIFGSIANGTNTYKSDIDLFVIGELGLRDINQLLRDVSLQLNREVNIVSMTVNEFSARKKENDHFVSEVIVAQKIMIIGSEDDLAKLGS